MTLVASTVRRSSSPPAGRCDPPPPAQPPPPSGNPQVSDSTPPVTRRTHSPAWQPFAGRRVCRNGGGRRGGNRPSGSRRTSRMARSARSRSRRRSGALANGFRGQPGENGIAHAGMMSDSGPGCWERPPSTGRWWTLRFRTHSRRVRALADEGEVVVAAGSVGDGSATVGRDVEGGRVQALPPLTTGSGRNRCRQCRWRYRRCRRC